MSWDATTEFGRRQIEARAEHDAIMAAGLERAALRAAEAAETAHFAEIARAVAPDWRWRITVGGTHHRLRGSGKQDWDSGVRVVTIYRVVTGGDQRRTYPLYRLEAVLLHELAHLLINQGMIGSWDTEIEADALGAALAIEYADLLRSPLQGVLDDLGERAGFPDRQAAAALHLRSGDPAKDDPHPG